MNVGHDTVIDDDVRPARRDGTCFYCRQPLGHQHNIGCVVLNKSVVMEFKLRVIIAVLRDWDKDNVEFRYNESTRCADNLVDWLAEWGKRHGCVCAPVASCSFKKEATAEDHVELPYLDETTEPVMEN